jgi:hypothetical protein
LTYQHRSDTLVRRSARLAARGGCSLAHSMGRQQNNRRATEMFLWEVDGIGDEDLYLDIVRFTEQGHERVSGLMFRALIPILAGHGVRCSTY